MNFRRFKKSDRSRPFGIVDLGMPEFRNISIIFILLFLFIVIPVNAQDFTFFANQIAGEGGALVRIDVVDPAATTGDDYQVTFSNQNDQFFYTVVNQTTGSTIIENSPITQSSPIVEGIVVSIDAPPSSEIRDLLEVQYGNTPVDPPVHIFRPGDRQGEGGNNSTGEYTFVGGGGNGGFGNISRSEANTNFFDYELRFDGNPQGRNKLIYGFTGDGTIDVPFSLWNIGRGTPNDPADDYQVIAVGFEDSGNFTTYDGGASPADGGSGTMYDRIYFFEINQNAGASGDINGDGAVNYDDVLQDIANFGGDISPAFLGRPYNAGEVIARFSMVSLNGDPNYLPPVGTTIRITTNKLLSANDVHEFTTQVFEFYTNPTELNFGSVQLGNALALSLTLINNSNSEISVSNIITDSPGFQVSQTGLSIAPGASADIDVTFQPPSEGVFNNTMTITSNDVFFPQYQLDLTGEGLPATTGIINILGRLDIPNIGVTDVWGYYDETAQKEYALIGGAGFSIVDVTDPARPELVSQVPTVPGFDVKAWQHYVYTVNGGSSGLGGIVDISDPANPQVVGSFPSSHNIFITDDGYMILEVTGVRVFDLNPDPTNPVLIWNDGSEGHDASVINNVLYDFHGGTGTFIYDFTNPASPSFISAILDPGIRYNHSGWTSADGNYLFICDELSNHPSPDVVVYDISNLNNPQRVGQYADPTATVHNLFILGDYAVTSYYHSGFQVLDVSDPTQPVLADQFDTSPLTGEGFGGAWGVYPFAPSGNIYISDQGTGLYIFELRTDLTAIDPENNVNPGKFTLFDNYPNPFNPETSIEYQIPQSEYVKLDIYNTLGQKIRSLEDAEKLAGRYAVVWDGKDKQGINVASGIYFYQLKAGDFIDVKRMLLVR